MISLTTPLKFCFQSKLKVNTGKDFTRDNIEIIITGPPGGFALVEGAELTLWKHGAKTFLTQEMVYWKHSNDQNTYPPPPINLVDL